MAFSSEHDDMNNRTPGISGE